MKSRLLQEKKEYLFLISGIHPRIPHFFLGTTGFMYYNSFPDNARYIESKAYPDAELIHIPPATPEPILINEDMISSGLISTNPTSRGNFLRSCSPIESFILNADLQWPAFS